MDVICKMLGHHPGPEVFNEGLTFAKCARCNRDVIRQRIGKWELVPPGLKVAWHPAGHRGTHWSKAIGRARDRLSGVAGKKPLKSDSISDT